MTDCIFCKIARGEIPAKVVWENEALVAFDDIAPQAPVHTLIIPRAHYANLADGTPRELLCELLAAAPVVAAVKGVAESGYRVIINNGPDSGQTVPHLHLHVLGGRRMAEGMMRFCDE